MTNTVLKIVYKFILFVHRLSEKRDLSLQMIIITDLMKQKCKK
jgi:hypothetical protein